MLGKLKSLGATRARNDFVVGLCLNRALAVAVASPIPAATGSHALVEELPTESLGQIKVLSKAVADFGIKGREAAVTLAPGSYTILQIERPPSRTRSWLLPRAGGYVISVRSRPTAFGQSFREDKACKNRL